jgi:hypothetical protein
MSEYSSSVEEEEEESDGGQASPDRDPRRRQRNKSARRWAVYGRGDARRGGAGAHRGGVWRRDGGGDGRGLSAREPSRKRKRGFSTLR